MAIVVLEPLCRHFSHERFNSAFLVTLAESFPGETIDFLSASDHGEVVHDLIPENYRERIKHFDVPVAERRIPDNHPARIRLEMRAILFAHRLRRRRTALQRNSESTRVIILSCVSTTIVLSWLINLIYFRHSTYIVVHQILETVYMKRPRNPKRIIDAIFWFPTFFRVIKQTRIRFLLLSPAALPNLRSLGYSTKRIGAIDLPWIFEENMHHIEKHKNSAKGRIGLFGISNHKDYILEMSKWLMGLRSPSVGAKVDFWCEGAVGDSKLFERLQQLSDQPLRRKPISREILVKEKRTIDLALIVYPPNGYRVSASCAFLEALESDVPIVALNNIFISHYGKSHSNSITILNDPRELRQSVIGLLSAQKKVTSVKHELSKLKEVFKPHSVSKALRSIMAG